MKGCCSVLRVSAGAAGQPLVLNITNAGESSYPSAWAGYKAVATYNMQEWFRVQDTSYDEAAGVLTIRHTPQQSCVRYAYWAPYSLERHVQLVMRMQVRQHGQHAPLQEVHGQHAPLQGRRVSGPSRSRDCPVVCIGPPARTTAAAPACSQIWHCVCSRGGTLGAQLG